MFKTKFLAFVICKIQQADIKLSFSGNNCLYKSNNGAQCFIGYAIPDDQYRPEWDADQETVSAVLSSINPLYELDREYLFYIDLQDIHDGHIRSMIPYEFNMEKVIEKITKLCNKYDVVFPSDTLIDSYKEISATEFWDGIKEEDFS